MAFSAKEKFVLWVALALIVGTTVYPPIYTLVSEQNSSGVFSLRGETHYEFLSTHTFKRINFVRLAIQYLIDRSVFFCDGF